MNLLNQSAFAEALGWSLIDSMWQMGAIWFFYILITGNGSRYSAEKKYSLALVGTAAGTLVFFISLAINYYSALDNLHFFSLAYLIEKYSGQFESVHAIAENIIPYVSFFYLPAVMFFALRLIFQVCINKKVYRKNSAEAEGSVSAFVNDMCSKSGIIKKVGVWISEKAEIPLTLGYWKPVIIIPVSVFAHLTYRQVEAVIAHELFHIRRCDYLINIFLTCSEVVLFFNPFAHLMFSIVKKERENSCDDHVINSGFDAWEYSHALYVLGRYRHDRNVLTIAATGIGKEFLLQRIRRILKRNNPSPSVLKPFLAFLLCLFVAGFAAREKQIPVLAVALTTNEFKPVVYYSVEKEITVIETVKNKINSLKNKRFRQVKSVLPPDSPPPPEVVLPDEFSEDEAQEIINIYIASPEVQEFTIIDPESCEIPVVICEKPQPFVQKSSFYYEETDTTVGKKVVVL